MFLKRVAQPKAVLCVRSPREKVLANGGSSDTEIDWQAYMEQVAQFLEGERDYTMIKGGTGPLVYPAAHVYIYSALYGVTDGGKNILLAQIIFGGLYLTALSLVMACYRMAKVPTRSNVSLRNKEKLI